MANDRIDAKSLKIKLIFFALFIFGGLVRAVDLWRPVDGRSGELWRECDYAAIARNYYQEGMNLLYPRVDWRGDGPGFAEMEFPIIPWSTAVLYKILGYHEVIGRFISYVFSLMSMIVFFCLARYLLNGGGACVASLFFVLSPLAIHLSNALQPEGMMLFFYLLAAYSFIRWLEREGWGWFAASALATSSAILVKANAAHIGLFMLSLLIVQKGLKSLRQPKIWLFGIVSLLPAFFWYWHAHGLWLRYGNSLGVSNEYHWIGLDLFIHPAWIREFVVNLFMLEVSHVWMFFGGVSLLALFMPPKNDRTAKIILLWLGAISIYYFVTIRTTADSWAYYYHIVTVPPFALLLGRAYETVNQYLKGYGLLIKAVLGTWVLGAAILSRELFLDLSAPRFRSLILPSILISIVPFLGKIIRKRQLPGSSGRVLSGNMAAHYLLFFSVISTLFMQCSKISRAMHPRGNQAIYECSQVFKPYVPRNSLIIASGGASKDITGHRVAGNAPYMFFWLECKGFNITYEEQSLAIIRNLIDRGARYLVLEKNAIKGMPQFLDDLKREYFIMRECSEAFLVKLESSR
jgi:4-amino-4-deoxy-L-arabinose transferase-like glycosyltransferase